MTKESRRCLIMARKACFCGGTFQIWSRESCSSPNALEALKKAKLPEDEAKRVEKDVQAATDRSIKEINDHLASKETELLNV